MSLGEGDTRTRLQVALERCRAVFVTEFDDDVRFPRSSCRGVRAMSGVVSRHTCRDIRGQTRVVATRPAPASQNVDEPLWKYHQVPNSKRNADQESARRWWIQFCRPTERKPQLRVLRTMARSLGSPSEARSGRWRPTFALCATVGILRLHSSSEAWLANRSSFTAGRPTVAPLALWWATSA